MNDDGVDAEKAEAVGLPRELAATGDDGEFNWDICAVGFTGLSVGRRLGLGEGWFVGLFV